jgi:hypothetical protein
MEKDVQLVPEYFDLCLDFMLDQESRCFNLTKYLKDL